MSKMKILDFRVNPKTKVISGRMLSPRERLLEFSFKSRKIKGITKEYLENAFFEHYQYNKRLTNLSMTHLIHDAKGKKMVEARIVYDEKKIKKIQKEIDEMTAFKKKATKFLKGCPADISYAARDFKQEIADEISYKKADILELREEIRDNKYLLKEYAKRRAS